MLSQKLQNLTQEDIVVILGFVGFLIALIWLVFRKPRSTAKQKKLSTKKDSISKKTDSIWWKALSKSRERFNFGKNSAWEELKLDIEEACLASDLGVQNTQEALESITWDDVKSENDQEQRSYIIKEKLSQQFNEWLDFGENNLQIKKESDTEPTVIWFVGVNGAGKTTSLAKLAKELKNQGFSVMVAAADTFRAAAAEQLETWAQRLDIPCVRGADNADSSSVLFNAIDSAKSKKVDFLLCDSAGRLHNQKQLMDALQKNKRVMNKNLEGAPHYTLLVLDANTGQNMIQQAKHFKDDVGLNGLILSKVDGTARGGAVVAIVRELSLPLYRLGLGESAEDFQAFNPKAFSRALVGLDQLQQ